MFVILSRFNLINNTTKRQTIDRQNFKKKLVNVHIGTIIFFKRTNWNVRNEKKQLFQSTCLSFRSICFILFLSLNDMISLVDNNIFFVCFAGRLAPSSGCLCRTS